MYACNTPNLFEGFVFELCRNWLELQVFSLELSLSEQRSLDQSWSQQYVVLKSQQLPSRGTQREYSSKPLKHSIVKRILLFKR